MKAREQSEKKSIKGAVVCRTPLTRSPTVWSRALLAMTGVVLRWKSFKKLESVKAGAMWRRYDLSLSVKFFSFFMLIRLAESHSAHLHTSTQKVRISHRPHHRIQHPHEYHHRLLVTATTAWHLIGNKKWNVLLTSEATSASFCLFSCSFQSLFIWAWCE